LPIVKRKAAGPQHAGKSIGCRYLLTEDLQTNQELDGILVVSPFLADPASFFAE
jgi:hypothetical protein